MNKPLTFALLLAGLLLLSGRSVEAQVFSLDGPTAGANGVLPDDLLVPGPGPPPPLVLAGGAGIPAPPSDVDAMSFGTVFPGIHAVAGVDFSVAPGSIGAAGTAVFGESGGVGGLDEPADIFGSGLGGFNGQLLDGDGVPAPGAAPGMGVLEPGGAPAGVSNTDAWDMGPPFGPLGAIHYSVAPADILGNPAFAGASAADIFISPPVPGYSVLPAVYAPVGLLGLIAPVGGVGGDDMDALAIVEDGVGGFALGADTVYFSLAPGSPTLLLLGASPADILVNVPGLLPAVAFPAAAIGLVGATDDVDALDLVIVPEPSTFLLCLGGLFSLGWLAWGRRRRA